MTPNFLNFLKELLNSFQTSGNIDSETINGLLDTDETVIAQISKKN